ncbi:MAG: DUF1302 family protein [Nevskia sp.]|nr:DUF1302 family protein [Nevskia sp.]
MRQHLCIGLLRRLGKRIVPLVLLCAVGPVFAIDFSFAVPGAGDEPVKAILNTTFTAGAAIRMQSPSSALISKANLDPQVCGQQYLQSCQGLFRTQIYPAQHLVAAPGTASSNGDQGDLNYDKKYDLIQAPLKLTPDLTLSWGEFGFFARVLAFYDAVNDNFTEYHPNELTADNRCKDNTRPCATGRFGTIVPGGAGLVPVIQGLGLPANTPVVSALFGNFYGPGGVVRNKRTDGETLKEIGAGVQYLDTYIFGHVPLWDDRQLSFKLGRQVVNWGESTLLVVNSINSANPLNVNNFYRVGVQTEEVFTPVNMLDLGFSPFKNFTAEGFYQLEWQPDQAPPPGSYFSTVNLGVNNDGNNASLSNGVSAQDPMCLARPVDNPLSGLSTSCPTIYRLPDWTPRTSGQFGIKLDYYAESLNNGTDFAFYYENYHSRLPFLSTFSAYPGCLRAQGNAQHLDASGTFSFIAACPNVSMIKLTGPNVPTQSALQLDTARFVFEYPEDIHLLGASFNTTVGDYSIQGEVAYRPNQPMQVDGHDLLFAALAGQSPHCGAAYPGAPPCGGSGGVIGTVPSAPSLSLGNSANGGAQAYPSSDAVDATGKTYAIDTINLILGAAGGQRPFNNLIQPYRHINVGDATPCYPQPGSADDFNSGLSTFTHPYYPYNSGSPCYIRGYERFQDFEFNLGATRVYSATDNPIGADQVTMLYELGAEFVPFMPGYDRLVLQAPGIQYGPLAGADGSGFVLKDPSQPGPSVSNPYVAVGGTAAACGYAHDCSYGPDGTRFNPHQQDHTGYPDRLSWGYRIISQISYEQIFPGVTLRPLLVFAHDVQGTSPGLAGNFLAGRKTVASLFEFRYHQSMSLGLGYNWYWGGGVFNQLSDRDFAQAFVRYQF